MMHTSGHLLRRLENKELPPTHPNIPAAIVSNNTFSVWSQKGNFWWKNIYMHTPNAHISGGRKEKIIYTKSGQSWHFGTCQKSIVRCEKYSSLNTCGIPRKRVSKAALRGEKVICSFKIVMKLQRFVDCCDTLSYNKKLPAVSERNPLLSSFNCFAHPKSDNLHFSLAHNKMFSGWFRNHNIAVER